MWPFNSNDEPEEKTKEYTRHTSKITFTDGEVEEIKWDSMSEEEGLVTFLDYTGVDVIRFGRTKTSRFEKEAQVSYSLHNIKKIETTDRERKELKYTV